MKLAGNGTADRLSFVEHGDVKVMTFGRCLELRVHSLRNGEMVIYVAVRQEVVSKSFSFSRARFEAIAFMFLRQAS